MKLLAACLLLCVVVATANDNQCQQFLNDTELTSLVAKAQLEIPTETVPGSQTDDDKCSTCVKTFVDRILGYIRAYVKENYCAKLPAAQQEACNKCIDSNKTVQGFFIGYHRLFAQGANYCIGKGDCKSNMTLVDTLVNSRDRLTLFGGQSQRTWEMHPNMYLYGHASPSGRRIFFDSLQPALAECDKMGEAKCAGVTLNSGRFELRRGAPRPFQNTILIQSPFNETSWLRGDANSVAYFALAQMMIGQMVTVELPSTTPDLTSQHSTPPSVYPISGMESQLTSAHHLSRFEIFWIWTKKHTGLSTATAKSELEREQCRCWTCKHWVNAHVVSSGLKSWNAYCKTTKCPFFQAVCKWGDANPQELTGYIIGIVEPWKYSDSYCYGKGVCPNPSMP